MPYRLNVAKPLRQSLRRSLAGQIDAALAELGATDEPERHIHAARKCLKRARALLRLIASGLPSGVAKDLERRIAAGARELSGTRDVHVLLATLDKLEDAGAPLRKGDAGAARRLIGELRAGHDAGHMGTAIRAATERLAEVATAIEALDLAAVPRLALLDGLRKTHEAGRARLHDAEREASEEALHELRKVVQRHWRQMALMAQAWPEVIAGRIAEARLVSERLGDLNDLAVLARHLDGEQVRQLSSALRARLRAACRRQQAARTGEAIERARRLFAEEPDALAEAIGSYWRSARRLARSAAARGATAGGKPKAAVKARKSIAPAGPR